MQINGNIERLSKEEMEISIQWLRMQYSLRLSLFNGHKTSGDKSNIELKQSLSPVLIFFPFHTYNSFPNDFNSNWLHTWMRHLPKVYKIEWGVVQSFC